MCQCSAHVPADVADALITHIPASCLLCAVHSCNVQLSYHTTYNVQRWTTLCTATRPRPLDNTVKWNTANISIMTLPL